MNWEEEDHQGCQQRFYQLLLHLEASCCCFRIKTHFMTIYNIFYKIFTKSNKENLLNYNNTEQFSAEDWVWRLSHGTTGGTVMLSNNLDLAVSGPEVHTTAMLPRHWLLHHLLVLNWSHKTLHTMAPITLNIQPSYWHYVVNIGWPRCTFEH